jgi:ABC-type branched-subunit amino acid transport system ATPase component
MLKISNLVAGYKKGPDVLHGVHLEVSEGEIITIIGPNGAGKSTLLLSIFGITNVREGTIAHGARELTGLSTDEILRSGIALVTQRENVFPQLTVLENLETAAWTISSRSERESRKQEVLKMFPMLRPHLEKKAVLLSGGERQMVALGMALMLSPEVLLLDEPSIGLAPKVVQEVFEKIQEIRKAGTSILMVEQNALAALEISDRGYVLELGRNALEGTGNELLNDPEVGRLFLGRGVK